MPGKISMFKVTGVADGSGNITAYSNTVARGLVKAIRVVFEGSSAATTDTTVSDEDGQSFLTLTDVNTSAWYYPRRQVSAPDGTASTYDGTRAVRDNFVVFGRVKLTVAQQTEAKAVAVYALVEEY